MAVVNPHIYYPGGSATAYDLRKVESWAPAPDGTTVNVRFISNPTSMINLGGLAAFEAAILASLTA